MKPALRFFDLDVASLLAFTADMGTLAERVGVSIRTLQRLTHCGLTVDQADRFAVALGVPAAVVWPVWDDPQQPVRRTFCQLCSRMIVQPVVKGARLRRACSSSCRSALSRSRHLSDRRRNDLARWHASKSPEQLAAHAARERARRARAKAAA